MAMCLAASLVLAGKLIPVLVVAEGGAAWVVLQVAAAGPERKSVSILRWQALHDANEGRRYSRRIDTRSVDYR